MDEQPEIIDASMIKSNATNIDLQCPSIVVNIVRENFTLMAMHIKKLKFEMKQDFVKKEQEMSLSVQKFSLESESGYKYL